MVSPSLSAPRPPKLLSTEDRPGLAADGTQALQGRQHGQKPYQGAGGDARDGEAPQTTLGCQLDRRRPPHSTSGKDHRGRQAEVAPLRKSTFRHGVVFLSSWPPESNLAARPTTWRPTSMSLSDHSKAEEAAIASRAKIAITTDHSPKLGRHWGRLGKSRSSTVGPAPLFQEVREGLEQARSGGERLGELRSPSALRV